MKKQKILISAIVAGVLFVGCGGDGKTTTTQSDASGSETAKIVSDDTTTQNSTGSSGSSGGTNNSASNTVATTAKEESVTVSGSVVDGPVYGGTVKIYGLDDSLLGNATTDSAGGYSTTIPNLPQKYKVKVSGGTDSGADGVQNSNDKALGFDMSAIVDRGTESNSTAHVTPATTMVNNIVEDGVIPLDDAQSLVRDGLGLGDESYPLCRLNPTKHDRANKAASLIALLTQSIKSSDKKAILQIIARSLAQKEIKIKITNTNTQIDTLDLVTLANRVAEESPDSISLLDIDKLEKCQALIIQSIEESIIRTKVTHLITTTDQEEILAHRSALTSLLQKIADSDLESLDAEGLATLYSSIVEGMSIVLAGGKLDASDPDNAALIADVIAANLDKDPADISSELIQLSYQYQKTIKKITADGSIKHKISTKKIIRSIYSQSSLDRLSETITALSSSNNLQAIAQIANSIEEQATGEDGDMQEALRLLLQKMIAGQLSDEIDRLAGASLTAEQISSRAAETLANDLLLSQIRSTLKIKVTLKTKGKKIRLTIRERAKITSCNQVLASMRMSVKIKGFTTLDSDSIDQMLEHITTTLVDSYDQETAEAYQEKIKALQLSLVNLSKKFDAAEFQTRTKTTVRIIRKIKLVDGSDIHKSIVKMRIKIKADFLKTTITLKETIEELEKHIGKVIVSKRVQKRLIKLPQPRLETLPTAPIMIAI